MLVNVPRFTSPTALISLCMEFKNQEVTQQQLHNYTKRRNGGEKYDLVIYCWSVAVQKAKKQQKQKSKALFAPKTSFGVFSQVIYLAWHARRWCNASHRISRVEVGAPSLFIHIHVYMYMFVSVQLCLHPKEPTTYHIYEYDYNKP